MSEEMEEEMQPQLVVAVRGHVSNSYQIFKPHFLFLSQNPKNSWDSKDSGKPPSGEFGAKSSDCK